MRKHRTQNGFTIIELLVVLAVISMMLLIAIPIYQTYSTRVQISEGIALVRSMRQAAAEHYMYSGAWPADNETAGLKPGNEYESHYLERIDLASEEDNASITITYKLPILGENNTIVFFTEIVNGHIVWHCTAGAVPDKYRPAVCRSTDGG